MDRRAALKAGIAGALGLSLPKIVKEGEGKIQGVGVLRYPQRQYQSPLGGPLVDARDLARELSEKIGVGSIVAFSSETDANGNFVWDFRIEGGEPGQVRIERGE